MKLNISAEGRLSAIALDPEENSRVLYELSKDPSHAEHVTVLDLRWIPLADLPIVGFSNLTHLYLHENSLSVLPEDLHRLEKLKVLSLGHNQISALPSSISYLWMTLERLILGSNQIQALPFIEEEMMIMHGSIGSNPLPEPVGEAWMFRQDARNCIEQLHWLSRPQPGTSIDIVHLYQDIFVQNCLALDEPMVYEALFEGYLWEDGFGLRHSEHHYETEVAVLGRVLAHIQPDVLLHPSIARKIFYHKR